jgi:hypothetical protein
MLTYNADCALSRGQPTVIEPQKGPMNRCQTGLERFTRYMVMANCFAQARTGERNLLFLNGFNG